MFQWDASQQKSFSDLKTRVNYCHCLAVSNHAKAFTLFTDASQSGLVAVLMQSYSRGKLGPIAYASHSLNTAEGNYSVTDHWPATFSFKGKLLSGRLARWALTTQEFNSEIEYISGRANTMADALSMNKSAVAEEPPQVEKKKSLLQLGHA